MTREKEIKVYEWISYIILLAATVVFVVLRGKTPMATTLTLLLLVVAVTMRMLMERARRKSYEEENESLKADLKHLTSILRKEKGNNEK